MESNPYSSPSANLFGSTSGSAEAVSETTIIHLQKTKPWVRFVGVLTFLAGGLMILGGAALAIFGGTFMAKQDPGLGNTNTVGVAFMGVFYAIMGGFYIFPAMKLWAYGSKIKDLISTRSVADLEAALAQQRTFWIFVGIMTLIGLCIFALMMLVFIFGGVMAASAAAAKQ